MRAVLLGTGMHVPANVVDNHRLSRLMDTSDEWIRKRTGIEERRFASVDEATSDLAVPAVQQALENAGVDKDELDYVVFATMTPDSYFPGSGAFLHRKLGLGRIPALDIRQQCAGFLYGLQLADAMIRSGQQRTVLVVGAEVHAAFLPWDWEGVFGGGEVDPETYAKNAEIRDRCVLFGDGAGAFVLRGEEGAERGLVDVMVHSDGQHVDKMSVPTVGSAVRPYTGGAGADPFEAVPIVKGREVFKVAVTLMPEAVNAILAHNGLTTEDVRLLICHQANLRINQMVQKRLGLRADQVFNNIQRYGNTTAATLPIAYHEAVQERPLAEGDWVCFVALGSGLNWGAALYRY